MHSRLQSKEEAGQALVEFALVLVFVILPFMFVLVDGAMTLYTYAMVTNAAREGARAGSIYQTPVSQSAGQDIDEYIAAIDSARAVYIRQEAQRTVGTLVSFAQCNTVITYTPALAVPGNPFREMDLASVSLSCPRLLFFGLIGTSQITLTGQATMRIEPGGVAPSP